MFVRAGLIRLVNAPAVDFPGVDNQLDVIKVLARLRKSDQLHDLHQLTFSGTVFSGARFGFQLVLQ